MSANDVLLYETKKRIMTKFPRFGTELANASISFRNDLPYHTAATDGKNVFIDPNYFASLDEDDRTFLVAHEFMHNKFKHMLRLRDKNGEMKDMDDWNYACDAIINANLEREGFKIKEGYVNRPEALKYSAEEFYEIVKEENRQEQQNDMMNNSEQQDQEGSSGQGSPQKQKQPKKQEGQEQDGDKEKQGGESQKEQGKDKNSQKNKGQSGSQEGEEQEGENQEGEGGEGSPKNGKQKSKNNKNKGQVGDHSLWEKAFEEFENNKNKKSKDKSKNKDKNSKKDGPDEEMVEYEEKSNSEDNEQEVDPSDINEKDEFDKNRDDRRQKMKEQMEKMKNDALKKSENEDENDGTKLNFGDVGVAKPVLDWKSLVRREIEKDNDIWTQRRSIAENNYAYRLEEYDEEDEAETEVMIDVSGSVDNNMVKNFLRQLKPLLKESKLRVGTFNEKFWGMQEYKTEKDIDHFTIPKEARGHYAWTEDWDLAVRSFTKKKEVNKIVFTDGNPCPGTMPKEDLKNENIIWICYDNKNFKPCCGKVIMVSERELEKMVSAVSSSEVSVVKEEVKKEADEISKTAEEITDYIKGKKSEKDEFTDMFDVMKDGEDFIESNDCAEM